MFAAASRNSTKIKSYEDVDVHTLYSFKLNQKSVTYKKEKLEIKKVQPPYMGGTSGKKDGVTDLSSFKEVASKNAMKRFRGKFLGKQVSVWVNECCATSFPSFSRFLIKGECLDLENTIHLVRGYIDLPINTNSKDIEGTLLWGTITAVDYDHENGAFIISVTNLIQNAYQTTTSFC